MRLTKKIILDNCRLNDPYVGPGDCAESSIDIDLDALSDIFHMHEYDMRMRVFKRLVNMMYIKKVGDYHELTSLGYNSL